MKYTVRYRLLIYGAAGVGYLLVLVASLALVAVPAVETVDRSLAPLQGVFVEIAERDRQVLDEIEALERYVHGPDSMMLALPGGRVPSRAVSPLLSNYGSVLPPAASSELARAEDAVAWIEAAIGEAIALREIGDRRGAAERLAEIRRNRTELQRHTTQALVLALETGIEARQAFRGSMATLSWLVIGWIVLGAAVWGWIAYDAARHVFVPVGRLEAGISRIAAGDWSERIPGHFSGELLNVANQFNLMTDTLRERAGRHAQMATAGELLAGMAHELNNPLQAIRGIAELGHSAAGPGAKDWAVVLEQARRASKLVNDLVRFVRPPVRRLAPVDLNDVVRDGLSLIGFQFRADGITIETELDPQLRPVQADANDLVQVLVNLLGNAHAVLHNGQISRRRVTVRTWTQGNRVGTTVQDNGPGVSEEVRERVFNPFFSTKDRGFGLGLSVARDILRGYGGDVVLDRVRDGASFSFWLPAIEAADAAAPSPVAHPQPAKGETFKGRRIVVADDEDAIRGVLARCLERDGAEVRTAAGGVMALELIRQQPPDAVLLDLRMPDLDGLGVYRRVRQVDPALAERIIFVTGDPSAMDPDLGIPAERILTKPVELTVMREAVRRVLAGA